MSKAKVLRTDYKEAAEDALDTKSTAVQNGLADHAGTFTAPPVLPVAIGAFILAYRNKLSAYRRGGLDQKEAYLNAKADLIDALDQDADYVDITANGSAELINNAGYVATKTTKSPKPAPVKPTGVKAKRGPAIGQILVECPTQKGGLFYGLIICVGVPLVNTNLLNGQLSLDENNMILGVDLNKSRKKVVLDLAVGTTYYFYMYCGNSNGISPLSDAVVLMAA